MHKNGLKKLEEKSIEIARNYEYNVFNVKTARNSRVKQQFQQNVKICVKIRGENMKKITVGVIGCGMISERYMQNMTTVFSDLLEIVACADINNDVAVKRAEQFGLRVETVDGLIDADDIELVVNLTVPAAHYELNKKALLAGKHVYCEKPLAETLEQGVELLKLAEDNKLQIASAPDTFLGAGLQTCRELIDNGEVGDVVNAFGFLISKGPEGFHPNPAFFYQPGGGPLLDMGPYYFTALTSLFGPVVRVTGFSKSQRPTRKVQNPDSPLYDTEFDCVADSFSAALIEFANGVIANVTTSWDYPAPYWESGLPLMNVQGTKGTLTLPDPNTFCGITPSLFAPELGKFVKLRKGMDEVQEVPLKTDGFIKNSRGLGVADMALAISTGGTSSISGAQSLHVLEIMLGVLEASKSDKTYHMTTTMERPASLSEKLQSKAN